MTSRDRVIRARQLLNANPTWGRRKINVELRIEFGRGLRSSVVDAISREMNRPLALRGRINTAAFVRKERRILREFLRKGNPVYLKDAINERWELYQQARREGLTLGEWRRIIRQQYRDNRWVATTTTRTKANPKGRVKGQLDPYEWLRDFRQRAIDEGEYIPPLEKPHKTKEQAKAEKARGRQRQLERKVLAQDIAKLPGESIFDKAGKYLGRIVDYQGRTYTVRVDGSIL